MTTHTQHDHETTRELDEPQASTRGASWPLALASVGVCLATAAAIALTGILG
jgi:hypothetical protein